MVISYVTMICSQIAVPQSYQVAESDLCCYYELYKENYELLTKTVVLQILVDMALLSAQKKII